MRVFLNCVFFLTACFSSNHSHNICLSNQSEKHQLLRKFKLILHRCARLWSFLFLFLFWRNSPQWGTASSFTWFLNHTNTHTQNNNNNNNNNNTPHSVGLLYSSDQLVAETSTWLHTTLTTDRHPCSRWDSNPQSQQASGRRPILQTARPPGPAECDVGVIQITFRLNPNDLPYGFGKGVFC